jgi:hypothetical protein
MPLQCELLPVVPLDPNAVFCPACITSTAPNDGASHLFDHHHHHHVAPDSPTPSNDSANSGLTTGLRRSCSASVLGARRPAPMLNV